jgi:hypothetical protein
MNYEEAISEIRKLLKAGEAQKALQLTLAVRKVAPRDPVVHKLIQESKDKLRSQELGSRGDFVKDAFTKIKQFKKDKDFESASKAAQELSVYAPENKKAQKLRKKMGIALIHQKLHAPERKQLEEAGEYEKLYQFYQRLKLVFPEYQKIRGLIKKTEKKLIEIDRERKKEFAAESLEKIKTFYKEGKFEKVINGAEELQAITHKGSMEAKRLLDQATRANEKEIETQIIESILKAQPINKAAFETNSEPMVKL